MYLPNELYTQNIMFPTFIEEVDSTKEGKKISLETKIFKSASLKDLYDQSIHDNYNKLDLVMLDINKFNSEHNSDPFLEVPFNVEFSDNIECFIQVIQVSGEFLFLPSNFEVAVKEGDSKIALKEISKLNEGDSVLCRLHDSIVGFNPVTEIRKKFKFELFKPINLLLTENINSTLLLPLGMPTVQLYVKVI